jgi:competence ComEA-like helix-hairpin-helix protein
MIRVNIPRGARMKAMRALTAAIGLLVGLAAPCGAQARSAAADKVEFEKVCGSCHASSMVSDIRTQLEWEETIEQMLSIGAKGTAEQLQAVRRVLLRTWTKVNVNTATAAQLPLVLDIDEKTAQALVKYRADHGSFQSLDDLKKAGINASKLEARKDRIAF